MRYFYLDSMDHFEIGTHKCELQSSQNSKSLLKPKDAWFGGYTGQPGLTGRDERIVSSRPL